MKKFIITEKQFKYIKENHAYTENNSLNVFNKEVRNFIYNILTGNIKNISEYWRINGIKKSEIFNLLKKHGIIIDKETNKENISETNKIENNNEILVPKNGFDKKVKRLYYELFNEEPDMIMTEDGEGATTAGASSGAFEGPLFGKPITRNIYNLKNK